jgi:hypothetical protein
MMKKVLNPSISERKKVFFKIDNFSTNFFADKEVKSFVLLFFVVKFVLNFCEAYLKAFCSYGTNFVPPTLMSPVFVPPIFVPLDICVITT